MSNLWDSSTISRFAQEAEGNFVNEYPCILKRISLTITNNVNVYELPDSVRSIRRITWAGYKLDPLGQRNMRDVFQSATQVGTPFWYVFNNVGANKIQFLPIPPSNVTPSGGDLYAEAINTDVIVEYWSMPDNATLTIPLYFKRRLLKPYVLRMCFGIEGSGQNLKNNQYFHNRWKQLKATYGSFLEELQNMPRKLCLNGTANSQYFPGQPLLPISRFGYGIGDEY